MLFICRVCLKTKVPKTVKTRVQSLLIETIDDKELLFQQFSTRTLAFYFLFLVKTGK